MTPEMWALATVVAMAGALGCTALLMHQGVSRPFAVVGGLVMVVGLVCGFGAFTASYAEPYGGDPFGAMLPWLVPLVLVGIVMTAIRSTGHGGWRGALLGRRGQSHDRSCGETEVAHSTRSDTLRTLARAMRAAGDYEGAAVLDAVESREPLDPRERECASVIAERLAMSPSTDRETRIAVRAIREALDGAS